MKKIAILLSIILSAPYSLTGQRHNGYFKNFLVTANGDGSCTEVAPCQGSQDWGGFPTANIGRVNQSNGTAWFFQGSGATSYYYDSMISRIIGANGWTYLDSNDFEYRWTYEDDNYAYSPSSNPVGSLIRVGFEIWDITNGIRLVPWMNDADSSNSFGVMAVDHAASSMNNDPITDSIYPRLPVDISAGESGYQEWLTASIAAGVASGGPATPNADGHYLVGSTGANYYTVDVGPEIMGRNVWFVWNLYNVHDDPITWGLPSGFSLAGMEKGSVVKIMTGVALPDTFSWVTPNVIDKINISQNNTTDTLFLKWTQSVSAYATPPQIREAEPVTYRLHLDGKLFKSIRDTIIYNNVENTLDYITDDTLLYQDFLDNWPAQFQMLPRKTFTFDLWAWFGGDSIKINGGSHYVYVNRYDYLSIAAEGIPTEFALHENYPNPFNPTTTLRFDLPEVSSITLTIYNMLGQRVRTFHMQSTPAGYHTITWNATNDFGEQVGAGVYLYQLRANQFVKTRKMVLLK